MVHGRKPGSTRTGSRDRKASIKLSCSRRKDSKGLADLGLIEVERRDRGKTIVSLTTLGKLLVSSNTLSNNNPNT